MKDKKERISIGKFLFYYFGAIPHLLFRAGYFAVTFPRRLRRMRAIRAGPKSVTYVCLSATPVKMHAACDLVRAFRRREGQFASRKKYPSFFDLLGELWEENLSDHWKLPTVNELECIRGSLLHSSGGQAIWALDDRHRIFVGYRPREGGAKAADPESIIPLLRGIPPDSRDECLVYAVSVVYEKIEQ